MQFIDESKIFIKSGDGGAGCVSFRREANVPKGGPDGGDGGRGGSVIFRCVPGLNTLIDFRYQQHFKARKGDHGKGRCMNGAAAKDVYIDVPVGTQILSEDTNLLYQDMTEVGQEIVLAKGGDGGLGNVNFKSSTNQAPRRATNGHEGQEMWVWLKLKLLSDAGLVGLPNAGKSTFLSITSRAKPKIADYPFTTLKPQLGVVYIDESEFVLADIPGLIQGAHQGVGLGTRFLKHIERCGVLLHLIDATSDDILEAYHTINQELTSYSPLLAEKKQIVALNKIDAIPEDELELKKEILEEEINQPVYLLSGITGQGRDEILRTMLTEIKRFRIQHTELPEEDVA